MPKYEVDLINLQKNQSLLKKTVKLNFDIDKNTNTTTYYEFSTSIPTTIITSFIM